MVGTYGTFHFTTAYRSGITMLHIAAVLLHIVAMSAIIEGFAYKGMLKGEVLCASAGEPLVDGPCDRTVVDDGVVGTGSTDTVLGVGIGTMTVPVITTA